MRLLIPLLLAASIGCQAKHNEDYYNKRFCRQHNGKAETIYRKAHIRTDCEFGQYVCETDWAKKIYESIGQAKYYSFVTGKRPCIIIIVKTAKDRRKVKRFERFLRKEKIKLFTIR
jgi:hypothetical protein